MEFFIQNVNRETMQPRDRINMLEQFGLIFFKIEQISSIKTRILTDSNTNAAEAEEQISDLREEIEGIFTTLPGLDFFNNLELECEPDVFLRGW